jgi:hypothetical protein
MKLIERLRREKPPIRSEARSSFAVQSDATSVDPPLDRDQIES